MAKQCVVCERAAKAGQRTCGSYVCQHVHMHRMLKDGCTCSACRWNQGDKSGDKSGATPLGAPLVQIVDNEKEGV